MQSRAESCIREAAKGQDETGLVGADLRLVTSSDRPPLHHGNGRKQRMLMRTLVSTPLFASIMPNAFPMQALVLAIDPRRLGDRPTLSVNPSQPPHSLAMKDHTKAQVIPTSTPRSNTMAGPSSSPCGHHASPSSVTSHQHQHQQGTATSKPTTYPSLAAFLQHDIRSPVGPHSTSHSHPPHAPQLPSNHHATPYTPSPRPHHTSSLAAPASSAPQSSPQRPGPAHPSSTSRPHKGTAGPLDTVGDPAIGPDPA